MRIREYKGPLTVLAMGTLGFSLFCIISAVALADPRVPNVSAIEPQNIVDSAFSNMNTMGALTVDVISQYVFTPTATPTPFPSPTFYGSNTPEFFVFPTTTLVSLTRIRGPGLPPTITRTPTRIPSNTPIPIPSKTPTAIPVPTDTPLPTLTPVPDTATPVPPTDTSVPPDTDTPQPPDTPIPTIPVNTSIVPDTPTEAPAQTIPTAP